MEYHDVAHYAGTFGLVLFMVLFGLVLYWVLKPGAKERFEADAQIPLKED
jgi:cbb3-type cytochrome oxidase subunit 3